MNLAVHLVVPLPLEEGAPVQLRSQLVPENEVVPVRAGAHLAPCRYLNLFDICVRRHELHLDFVRDLRLRRQWVVAVDGVHGVLALLDARAVRGSVDVA